MSWLDDAEKKRLENEELVQQAANARQAKWDDSKVELRQILQDIKTVWSQKSSSRYKFELGEQEKIFGLTLYAKHHFNNQEALRLQIIVYSAQILQVILEWASSSAGRLGGTTYTKAFSFDAIDVEQIKTRIAQAWAEDKFP